jgi:hypothetical protein
MTNEYNQRYSNLVSIAPVAGEPGLIAYECPKCSYVTSVLVQYETSSPGNEPAKSKKGEQR